MCGNRSRRNLIWYWSIFVHLRTKPYPFVRGTRAHFRDWLVEYKGDCGGIFAEYQFSCIGWGVLVIQVVFDMSKPHAVVVHNNLVALMWLMEWASEVACELLRRLVLQVTLHNAGQPDRVSIVWGFLQYWPRCLGDPSCICHVEALRCAWWCLIV